MLAQRPREFIDFSELDTEVEDDESEETVGMPQFAISGYGADYDVEGLVRRLDRKDILIPDFQRNFVWSQIRSSRFIESLLMGLPVPGVFFYRESDSQKLLIIDGHQRLMSLQYFYRGQFESTGRRFQLKGLETKFDGLMYRDLLDEDRRRLDDSIIHATVIRQDLPDDNGSSQYFIFERLNTGATALSAQEIRSAAYNGEFNDLLEELNNNVAWREMFGSASSRKRDEELILRFLALFFRNGEYKSPMKSFLNTFMKHNQNLSLYSPDEIRESFESTVTTVLEKIGKNAFRRVRTVNAALLDSVMVGIARRLRDGPILSDLSDHYRRLRSNDLYESAITSSTADTDKVKERIRLATEVFSNVD